MGARPHMFENIHDYSRAAHKFCSECGQPMRQSSELAGFDTETGRPLMRDLLVCSWELADSTHDKIGLEFREVGEKVAPAP